MAKRRGKGRLVVIEGSDGSGKGTQARILLRRLRAQGVASERISFPQYGKSFFAGMVAEYLRGELGQARAVHPKLASLLYAGDRWEAREKLLRMLDAGKVVVCDRYVDSNKAHQAARLDKGADVEEFLNWVDQLEYKVLGLPRADLTIFLHVPHEVAGQLVARKGKRAYLRGQRRDMHEADKNHLRSAEQIYLHLAGRLKDGRRALVRCMTDGRLLSKSEVAERVFMAAQKALRGI